MNDTVILQCPANRETGSCSTSLIGRSRVDHDNYSLRYEDGYRVCYIDDNSVDSGEIVYAFHTV
jgi:hypothetical protein